MSAVGKIDWIRSADRGAIPLGVTSVREFNFKSDGTNFDDLTGYTATLIAKASFDDEAGPILWFMDESNGITLQLGTTSVRNTIFTFDVAQLAAQSVPAGVLQYQYTLTTPTPAAVPGRRFQGRIEFTRQI